MSWHVDTETAASYATRATDPALAASVEAHMLACEQCRATVSASADDAVLSAAWEGITDILDTPRLGWIERTSLAVGCSDATGRIIAATTRARRAYLFVVAFNVLVAISSSWSGHSDVTFAAFLLVAPLGSLVATAGAFGRHADPCYPLTWVLPTSTLRVVLIRTIAGVVPALLLTAAALPWLADRGWVAVAWLLPSLALALATLALATWVDVELAALIVAGVWITIPIALRLPVSELIDLLSGPMQLISTVAAAVAAMTAIARRSKFDSQELS